MISYTNGHKSEDIKKIKLESLDDEVKVIREIGKLNKQALC